MAYFRNHAIIINTYMRFFVFGNNPHLSISELYSVIPVADFSLSSNQASIISVDNLNLDEFGGIVKSGQIIGQVKITDSSTISKFIINKLGNIFSGTKISFGISEYCLDKEQRRIFSDKKLLAFGLETKKQLKQAGIHSRFVRTTEQNLSSATVQKAKLLSNGAEFCLFLHKDSVYIGITDWVQPFEKLSERDYGKPFRDAKSGMLPPKLAMIMLNLALSKSSIHGLALDRPMAALILLDPFCGSGTIAMEAALHGGIKTIYCSDISQKAVDNAKGNINWLKNKYELKCKNINIFLSNAENISGQLKEKINTIVAEGYLGPAQSGEESRAELVKVMSGLKSLYIKAIKEFYKITSNNARIVLAVPYFKHRTGDLFVDFASEINQYGFKIINPFPKSAPDYLKQLSKQGGLLYGRQGQRVYREILVMERV